MITSHYEASLSLSLPFTPPHTHYGINKCKRLERFRIPLRSSLMFYPCWSNCPSWSQLPLPSFWRALMTSYHVRKVKHWWLTCALHPWYLNKLHLWGHPTLKTCQFFAPVEKLLIGGSHVPSTLSQLQRACSLVSMRFWCSVMAGAPRGPCTLPCMQRRSHHFRSEGAYIYVYIYIYIKSSFPKRYNPF